MVTLRHSAAGHWTHSILAASRGGHSEIIIQYTLFENKVFVVMLEAIARQGQGARFENISDIFFQIFSLKTKFIHNENVAIYPPAACSTLLQWLD